MLTLLIFQDDKEVDINNFVVLSPFKILQGESSFPQCIVNAWMCGGDCECLRHYGRKAIEKLGYLEGNLKHQFSSVT